MYCQSGLATWNVVKVIALIEKPLRVGSIDGEVLYVKSPDLMLTPLDSRASQTSLTIKLMHGFVLVCPHAVTQYCKQIE